MEFELLGPFNSFWRSEQVQHTGEWQFPFVWSLNITGMVTWLQVVWLNLYLFWYKCRRFLYIYFENALLVNQEQLFPGWTFHCHHLPWDDLFKSQEGMFMTTFFSTWDAISDIYISFDALWWCLIRRMS